LEYDEGAEVERTHIWSSDKCHNDGSVESREWSWEKVYLPPFPKHDMRLVLEALRHKTLGKIGIDAVRLSTDEKCSPRLLKGY